MPNRSRASLGTKCRHPTSTWAISSNSFSRSKQLIRLSAMRRIAVLAALDRTVLADKKGADKAGRDAASPSTFPNSQLYGSPVAGPPSYTAVAQRFAADSLWDDFLAFHYTGRSF